MFLCKVHSVIFTITGKLCKIILNSLSKSHPKVQSCLTIQSSVMFWSFLKVCKIIFFNKLLKTLKCFWHSFFSLNTLGKKWLKLKLNNNITKNGHLTCVFLRKYSGTWQKKANFVTSTYTCFRVTAANTHYSSLLFYLHWVFAYQLVKNSLQNHSLAVVSSRVGI